MIHVGYQSETCAHGSVTVRLPRPEHGPGWVQEYAQTCGLCAGQPASLPYKLPDPE